MMLMDSGLLFWATLHMQRVCYVPTYKPIGLSLVHIFPCFRSLLGYSVLELSPLKFEHLHLGAEADQKIRHWAPAANFRVYNRVKINASKLTSKYGSQVYVKKTSNSLYQWRTVCSVLRLRV